MFFALAASSLLFSACSSDDAVVSTEGQNEAVQQIVLQVASSGDGLTTRAGRPLYSSEALQTIQNVRVVIYNADTKEIVKDATQDWTKSTTYNNHGHGRQFTLTFKGNDRLEKGNYKVMAVGYSNESDYEYSLNATSAVGLTYNDITATLKAGKKEAEEVFAGDADLKIGDDKKITNLTSGEENGVAVTLHRQVAGSFGYFQNIPASVNGKAAAILRLVVRDKNDMLTFNNFNSSFTDAATSTIKYYVNGSKSASAATADAKFNNKEDGYVLYSINLNTWFPGGDQNSDGVLNAEDTNWKHPDGVNTQVVKGSVFGSNFVIPFKYTEGKNTMELQLLDADNNIIKTWTVSIPASDLNSNKANGATDASASIFNVVRNHMYNLGVKTSNGTTPDPSNPDPKPTDPDPDKPKPGTDEPEDLSKSQNLILKVNDNWEAIHKMELGD
ncbi:hypothetical protein [Segatella copri]|uniref:Major fimbrial subunit protein N-terminal domain-containing protein n=1 Tax=Segatella copri TaxID=165179 RepID=A0AAW5ICK5_9BACT|nr:hypothetical protein [Segatella copri]MCP9546768.1 hypothetical protein [Segatella copri]MCP9550152.1 hypothetical protein [Segatella copri]MCP9556419.1 hypothetical protein [Segatella copri]MCP9571054.1 hypothetical protein [Segatella copri]